MIPCPLQHVLEDLPQPSEMRLKFAESTFHDVDVVAAAARLVVHTSSCATQDSASRGHEGIISST